MQYSCAYFTDPKNSLEQAQLDKKAHIAAKLLPEAGPAGARHRLRLGRDSRLYLNRVADVDVLGVTLSEEQLAVARERAEDAGVSDRVKFELIDYRDVDRPVRPDRLDRHVRACRHAVGDRHGERARTADHGRLRGPEAPLRLHASRLVRDVQDQPRRDRRLYDERFYRLYLFYLAASMTMFTDGAMVVYQLQYLRSRYAAPMTRNYMIEDEERLRKAGGPPPQR
jgi:cyclopropane-fatty-acyl-phospholipid synthase